MNRYTPIPPITSSVDGGESDSNNASSDDENLDDEETELGEDFQIFDQQYADVKPVMKKRMLALSELETFDDEVRNYIYRYLDKS